MNKQLAIERHPFEPFLPEGARMLFLGSQDVNGAGSGLNGAGSGHKKEPAPF